MTARRRQGGNAAGARNPAASNETVAKATGSSVASPSPKKTPKKQQQQQQQPLSPQSPSKKDATSPSSVSAAATSASSPQIDALASPATSFFSALSTVGLDSNTSSLPVAILLVFSFLVRWVTGLWPYSGYNTPPTFGDYEAQRHWMELTYHLPIRQWYYFSPDHWRLDYPPLTAYVSWLCGFVGHHINPEWMALDTSRGFEDAQSKMFMRFTVVVLEYIVYVPAVVIFVKQVLMPSKLYSSSAPVMATLAVVLLQPALIIIDNAHFQYNSMMLGFTLWAVLLFGRQQYVLGSVFFCFALMFKQMALFYSPAIFFYLLGKCLLSPSFNGVPLGRIWLLTKIGIAVIATFVIMLAPFMSSTDDLLQVFKRIFPVARGLYEDKVANFWCAISIAVKLREKFELSTLMRGSAGMTALAFLPSVLHVFWYARKHLPTSTSSNSSSKKGGNTNANANANANSLAAHAVDVRVLLYALVSCSLAFFMFSFQVHEKSILIPALPIVLLYPFERELVLIFVNTAMMSMFPLLKRVELSIPYAALLLLWNVLDGYPFRVFSAVFSRGSSASKKNKKKTDAGVGAYCGVLVTLVIAVIHGLDLLVTPPERYPHIFIMLNMIFSAGVFGLTLLYLTYRQLTQF